MPGGGSVAAVVTAFAAALVGMTARLSREIWPEAGGAAAQAEALRARVAPLAEADARAYSDVLTMLDDASTGTPGLRDVALGNAFSRAADLPLHIAEIATDVAELSAYTAKRCDLKVRPDATAAALLAEAAARICADLVAVNLTAGSDDERLGRARESAEAAERAVRLAFASPE